MIRGNYILDPKLDESKKEAIQTTEGALLIIAGPGSGKTLTLVERIIYLIYKGVSPEEIFVATFTEKAAKELITRVSNRLLELEIKVNLNEMYIGTLHSLFLRILEENREFTRLKRSYRILDQFDQKYLVYNNINLFIKVENSDQILGDHRVSGWNKAGKLLEYVNKIAEECLNIDQLLNSDDDGIKVIAEFYTIYERLLADENTLDFSFIQVETLHLLKSHKNVLKGIQGKLRYYMIDEYQDTNTIQEKIILLLSNKENNICVVGDDDQGLYRFRGATIRNILEFPSNYPMGECKEVRIDTNYRSHPDIIEFYNKWMDELDWSKDGMKFRFDKTIKPRNDEFSSNPSVIKVSQNGSLEDYYEEVFNFITNLEKNEVLKDRNQLAFLFKSVKNQRVLGLADYLEGKGIQVFSPRSALFFEREEIQLMLGVLVFIFPDLFDVLKWSDTAHLRIWDYYESCKKQFADKIRDNIDKHKYLLKWSQHKAKSHLTLQKSTNYGFSALIYQLLEYEMFSEYLQADLSGNKNDLRAAYNISLLTKLLYKFEYLNNVTVITVKNRENLLKELFNKFFRFIYDGGIEEYEDFDEYAPTGCVSFMTIHQSKGLEFPITVVGSLKSVPRKQYTETDELLQKNYYLKPPFEPIEETKNYDFWRLYYTAFSRAQNLLVLSAYEERTKKDTFKCPSKYFAKLYNNVKSWKDESFSIKKLELAKVKATNIKHEYSFTSHILLYENCPLQYKFYKELEFTEVRTGGVIGGTLLHQTIEDIHKAVLKGEEHKVTDENITQWFNTNYELLVKQLRSYLREAQQKALLKQVLSYKRRNDGKWDRIKEAEVDVSFVKEDYILKGTIDLIKGENDTVELIDFKSGDKPNVNSTDENTRKLLDRYRRQLEVYSYLVEERTGYKVSKMHLYYPKEENGNPHITFPKKTEHIESTINSFDDVVTKIENKEYSIEDITKNEKQCGNCDMRYHCNPRQYN
jgi:DNA helicase II / ATP-dependent DNA helicase PcrA